MREISGEREIIIFGVGDIGTDLYERMKELKNNPVVCFCDNNTSRQGNMFKGIRIISPAEAVNKYPNGTFVITVINHKQAVKEQLLDLHVPDNQIITFSSYDFINDEDKKRQERKRKAYFEWCRIHNAKIRELKNQYSGKRCFIIGNGGSLTINDLEMLKDEYTFGCNRIYKIFSQLSWRPTFYCFYDIQRTKKIKNDLPYILNNCDYLFTSSTIKDELCGNVIDLFACNSYNLLFEYYYNVHIVIRNFLSEK